MSVIEATAEQMRLASIADRHLAMLAKLPLKDRSTVATTILGSIIMDYPPSDRLPLLQFLIEGLLLHIEEEGAGS